MVAIFLVEERPAGDITSSALTERLNLERQEAADVIERLEARVQELEAYAHKNAAGPGETVIRAGRGLWLP